MKEMVLTILVFYPFLGGLLVWAAGRKNKDLRDYLADFIVISEFVLTVVLFVRYAEGALLETSVPGAGVSGAADAAVSVLGDGPVSAAGYVSKAILSGNVPEICGFGLHFTLDGFRLIYALIASFMWMMTTVISREYMAHHKNSGRFYLFLLLTLGATMGVFLSADLYTTFIFFEIMSFTSYVWVAQEESRASLRAASTYLGVAVFGGLVMLMGIFVLYHTLGTLTISELRQAASQYQNKAVLYAAGGCLLVGFGAKAGAFPLHIWLPKAHPVAPAPASALLSGILTKTGIFGILVTCSQLFLHDGAWGKWILGIGTVTMLTGALLAVFSVDLKRTLACSSMSQIGFIMVGAGMQGLLGAENALAVHGTFLHMANHSLIKLVLFMAAGVIFMNVHVLNLNEIRGFGRRKPLLKVIFLIGALAIGGIPLFGGYVSKTLLHESIVEYGGGWAMRAVEYLFLFSGGLTVAYMTKLYAAIFVEQNEDRRTQEKFDAMKNYMNPQSAFALAGSALVLLIWGAFPHGLMDRAAQMAQGFMQLEHSGHAVQYFSVTNLQGAAVSIVTGAAVYLLFVRKVLMRPEKTACAERMADKKVHAEKAEREEKTSAKTIGADVRTVKASAKMSDADVRADKASVKMSDADVEKTAIHRKNVDNTSEIRRYVDIWPSWLDLENTVYRPVFLHYIPAVLTFVCRIADTFIDLLVVGLRKTIYRDSPLPHERPEGNVLTEMLGSIMNLWQEIGNRTWHRKDQRHRDYVHALAIKNDEIKENHMVIGRSLSFGLLLVCIGICLTLIYIILW